MKTPRKFNPCGVRFYAVSAKARQALVHMDTVDGFQLFAAFVDDVLTAGSEVVRHALVVHGVELVNGRDNRLRQRLEFREVPTSSSAEIAPQENFFTMRPFSLP